MEMMHSVITWFGWGDGVGAIAAISGIVSIAVLLAPVVVGLVLYCIQRIEIALLKCINVDFAYCVANFGTFPGLAMHELAHALFGVLCGAEIDEIVLLESDDERLGHVSYYTRGPWFLQAIQHTLVACAPTVIGCILGYILLQYIIGEPHSAWGYIGLGYLFLSLINHATMSDTDLGHYVQGFWIFILPLFLTFFVTGMLI